MTCAISALTSCGDTAGADAPWIVDRFDDIKVIRYEVPGFDELPLREKELIYYLAEAAKSGRDILYDQNCRMNLPVRRTLEVVYENYTGDRTAAEWKALENTSRRCGSPTASTTTIRTTSSVPSLRRATCLTSSRRFPRSASVS